MFDPVLLDPRLFIAFAFLNHQGFDDEHRKEGMHPVRIAVRQDLQAIPEDLAQTMDEFSRLHPDADWFAYTQYALMLDPPPKLVLSPIYKDTWAASVLLNFDGFLRSFYPQAHIDVLWDKYRPAYEQEAALFRPNVFKSFDRMWDYLRMGPTQQQTQVRIVPNLLNSYHRATVFPDPATDMLYVICGPYSDQSPIDSTVVHEVLHTVTGPLLQAHQEGIGAKQELLALVQSLPTVKDNYGGNFKSILDESLIRALTKRISLSSNTAGYFSKLWQRTKRAGVRAHTQREYEEGFVLIWYFYEKLVNDFEKSDLSFADYFPKLLEEINIDHEQNRWGQKR